MMSLAQNLSYNTRTKNVPYDYSLWYSERLETGVLGELQW